MFRFVLLACLFASSQAFMASMPPARLTTARPVILSEAEMESIMQSASDCAEGECNIDDVNELIFELKEQQDIMQARLEKTMNMIADLQRLNQKAESRDEVRAFVQDMLRVFSHDKPNYPISGFSGDIGKGAQTAWDALPPKKWTPSAGSP